MRYRQERELEVLAQKLNESARECKNSKHQQERVISEKEHILESRHASRCVHISNLLSD